MAHPPGRLEGVLVCLNGRFVPEERAVVSIFDRGFLYGDGLFETVRIYAGEPFLWREHLDRLKRGAEALQLRVPLSPGELLQVLRELVRRNAMEDGLARITVTRGAGRRGYSPKGADDPTFAITLHPLPAQGTEAYRVVVASPRLYSGDRLAQFKHLNKLVQVAARMEADAAGADEALLLNERGEVVEGSSSNLFWIRQGQVCTPPLADGILPGITRHFVFGLVGGRVREESVLPEGLLGMEGIFLTSSAMEVMEVAALAGKAVARSPVTQEIKALYRQRRAGLK